MPPMSRRFLLGLLLFAATSPSALAWHDTGHMLVAQIAYLRLTPAARARVDSLLVAQPNRRPLIHLCAGVYTPESCEKTYDPITIAVWMDDFRGDSLNESYAPWHYVNLRPLFDGIPEASNAGAEPENALARINWAIDTLRRGTGSARKDAETLGFLYHLVGDVHQPLHAATRFSAAQPEGDSGGNGFKVQMPAEARITNLHALWDAAGGSFGFAAPKRPLDQAARDRLLALANEVTQSFRADAMPEWKDLDPHTWAVESNTLSRQVAYAKIRDGEQPTPAYLGEVQKLSKKRIAIAGYRLAGVLNALFVK